ncbi:MAG: monovalent cation/H(+) antiporter subunit G [Candidatus Puniceispirillaceae bacterium]
MDAQLLISVLSGCFILLGVLALLIGALGLLRLPDVYCRIHAVGMIDTAGASFIILGLAIHEGFTLVSVKLALVGIFLFFTSPIATHAVAQVAHKSGVVPVGRNLVTAKAAKKPAAAPAAAKAKPKQAAKTGSKVSRKSRGAS